MSSGIEETVLVFGEPGAERVGVLSLPETAGLAGEAATETSSTTAVIIVVGGPQTRVGSHRQFVLMARALARAGHPCLRFDLAGMGDSPGPRPDFEAAGPDLQKAADALLAAVPACRRIALWGLCDGATAAVFHAATDARIAAVLAANPWARSDSTRSAALVSGHYGGRLKSPEFWKKLLSGRIDLIASGREAIGHLLRARGRRTAPAAGKGASAPDAPGASGAGNAADLPLRLATALAGHSGRVRLQLSGRDLTAEEFEIAMTRAGQGGLLGAAFRVPQADHTFSDPVHWQSIIDDTLAWLGDLESHRLCDS